MTDRTAQRYEELGWGLSAQRQSHSVDSLVKDKFGMARLWSRDGVYESRPEEATVRAVLVVEGVMRGRYQHSNFDVTTGTFVVLDGEEEVRGENVESCARFYWQFRADRFVSSDLRSMFGEPFAVPEPYGHALTSVTNVLLNATVPGMARTNRALSRVHGAAELLLLALMEERADTAPISADLHRSGLLTEATTVIEEAFHDPDFSVDKLARRLSISRSSLSRLFQSIGRTPYGEILRLRVQRAHDLLADAPGARASDIEAVAGASGFRSRVHMRRALRRASTR